MSTKRVLHSLRLDKIAAVGSPCQAPALVAIIKRAPKATDPQALAKATFQEALQSQLMSERVSEAFYEAFDDQWACRSAFQTALTDELSSGGDGTTATDAFVAAIRSIAESAAEMARSAATETPDDPADQALADAVSGAVTKWLNQQETEPMKIINKAQLLAAVAGFAIAKSSMADGQAIIDAAVTLDALDTLDGQPELLAAAKARKAPVDGDVIKGLLRDNAILKMAAPVRSYFDTLAADAQDAFIAKSDADRQVEVDAANATDPVLYKTAGGIEIRKSHGEVAAALAKSNDELAAKVVKLEAGASGDAIEKRAMTDFSNVTKSVAIDMLKSAAALGEQSDAGKAVLASLGTMNKARSTLFTTLGTTEAPVTSGDIQKARTDFNGEVNKIMARDSIGMGDAMSKARNEHPDLFAEAYPDTATADAE